MRASATRTIRAIARRARRFGRDRQGHAAAEFVALLPLYLAMIAGMYYLGDLAVLKQQCVEAARYYAWGGTGSDAAFFRGFMGSGNASASERTFSIGEADVRKELDARGTGGAGARPEDARLMASLLAPRGRPWLVYKVGEAAYRYRPSFYAFAGVAPEATVSAECTVLFRTANDREAFRPGSHRHPIESAFDEAGRPWHPAEDPYAKRDRDVDNRGRRSPWDVDWFKDKHPRE